MPYFGGEGGDEGVKLRLGTSISFTGTWAYPYYIQVAPPDSLQNQGTAGLPTWGSWIETFIYFEKANFPGGLTALTFNDLVGVKGAFTPNNMPSLTTLSLPLLTNCGGTFGPNAMANLTTLNVPNLITAGNFVNPNTMASLTTLSFPALVSITTGFAPTVMASLTTLSAPNLAFIGTSFLPGTMASLTTISLPALATVLQAITIGTMASLTTINLPALVAVGSDITANAAPANVVTVTLGAAGTTKYFGGNVNFSGQKLNQASVDQILHTVASLDGTGGTVSWGTGKTLTLNGGTNSTPSATGLSDKAIIVARGGTVLNN